MEHSLLEQIRDLPRLPGVYIFKNKDDVVIYIGKTINLFKRINSYFLSRQTQDIKFQKLVNYIHSIDFIIANSEQHALILESDLIKKYRPRFNVRLRDDKTFPYIKIDIKTDWPRVFVTRHIINDGAKYFGPFVNSLDVKKTLDLVRRIFKYRSCKYNIGNKRLRPCLNYHIGCCPAPCAGFITEKEYKQNIKQIIRFLEGKQETIIRDLKHKMYWLSSKQEYEKAAKIRDQINALQNIIEGQRIGLTIRGDKDAIAIARKDDLAAAEIFRIRNNRLISRQTLAIDGSELEDKHKVLSDFIKLYYSKSSDIPSEILLENQIDDLSLIEGWLRNLRNKPVKLLCPVKGEKRDLINMVAKNAENNLTQIRINRYSPIDYQILAEEIRNLLALEIAPNRIEGFDISNIQGKYAVGSMVVFEKGKPSKSKYRKFRIKNTTMINDYSMIAEVLKRRFSKYLENIEPWIDLPDLILIDGGKGHLNIALNTLMDLDIKDIKVISLAKENEEVYRQNDISPLKIPNNSRALHLLQWVRDEAHRFAIGYHRKIRGQGTLKSELDAIPGIGPKRKRALFKRFGSITKIKDATYEELRLVPGITTKMSTRIKQYIFNS